MRYKAFRLRDPVNLAFLTCVSYWIYLVFTTRMDIVWDAVSYESLGKMLAQQGWVEFFRTRPNREPFYPSLIAFSMRLGKISSLSYQLIQVLLQLSILFLTQILTLRILRLLKINNLFSALTILYLGISPAIVNSALSLYSEIATYPFILTIMLLIYKSWLSLSGPRSRIILLATATGSLFIIMALNKVVFELVTPMYIFLFLFSALLTRNRKIIINFFVYLMIFLTVFYLLLNGYKMANKTFNGVFTVTNRGAYQLYGEVVLRMKPLTSEHLFIALASVPGEGVCKFVFGKKGDRYSSSRNPEVVGKPKRNELNQSSMSPEEVDNALMLLSLKEVLKNPGQYLLFTAIEGLKMFFWESTQIGYVIYPPALEKLFAWVPFKNGLRLGVSFLTIFSLAYLVVLLLRQKKNILNQEGPLLFLYLCLLFIFSFVGSYSLFWIIPRYSFPIASLYLIIIAYVSQIIYMRIKNKGEN